MPMPPLPGAGAEPQPPISSLTLDPMLLAKAKGDGQECKPGEVYKVSLTVKARPDGGFDVMDTDGLVPDSSNQISEPGGESEPTAEDNADEDAAEEKTLGYKRPKPQGNKVKFNASDI